MTSPRGHRLLDTLIVNAQIVDGSGSPAFRGELGIDGGRIVHIARSTQVPTEAAPVASKRAARTIDAAGQVVAPGFIDLHSHADFSVQGAPAAETQLIQGVTTSLVGNCGASPFPARSMREMESANQHLDASFVGDWTDAEGFLSALERSRPGINIATQVGHSAIRTYCLGAGDVRPRPEDLNAMKRQIAAAAEAGVFGFSSGLIYAPGSFAAPDEVTELAGTAAAHGLLYSTHLRNEADQLVDAVAEAIAAAEQTGVRLEISHLKAMGPANHGKPVQALAMIEAARARGVDVKADVYPYAASSTTLTSRLPRQAMDGGTDAMVARIADPSQRARIAASIAARFGRDIDPAGIVVAALGPNTFGDDYSWSIGLGLVEISTRDGCSPEEAAMRLLHAHHGSVAIVNHAMDPRDVEAVLSHPLVSVASDGWTLTARGTGRPHPRSFGTFARVLGRYVRERKLLPLEEAVRKMTSQPAECMELHDRGLLEAGKVADVVIFNPDTIGDHSRYDAPWQLSTGVSTVLVAGEPAVSDGKLNDIRYGQVLRRS